MRQVSYLIRKKFKQYWPMIKSLQTLLLLITGLAGFMSSRCPWLNPLALLNVAGSLTLAISGSTVLNMWYDRDIDAKMQRTHWRPLPSGEVSPRKALILGLLLSAAGIGWASGMDLLYGGIVFAGLFFDVVVYTFWLKRKTAWSIIWGGIAGGMPVLAGRALGAGGIDWIGIMLMMAVLFWIPTHILTFSIKYHKDYQNAGVPTFPAYYGFENTRKIIALASLLTAAAMGAAAFGISIGMGGVRLLIVLSIGLCFLSIGSLIHPTEKLNFGLFKYASLYMLTAMILIAVVIF
ncbi:MAG: protoheme IX farnesyltransferase [Anaerolineaceae bacterium]|nr:protoheme IX farnesyltransferase [Anaerolineaceae bacterium]